MSWPLLLGGWEGDRASITPRGGYPLGRVGGGSVCVCGAQRHSVSMCMYVCADLEVYGCLRRDKGDHGGLVLALHGAVQGGLATGVLWATDTE